MIVIRGIGLPCTVLGVTLPGADGDFYVYINTNVCEAKQKEAMKEAEVAMEELKKAKEETKTAIEESNRNAEKVGKLGFFGKSRSLF